MCLYFRVFFKIIPKIDVFSERFVKGPGNRYLYIRVFLQIVPKTNQFSEGFGKDTETLETRKG